MKIIVSILNLMVLGLSILLLVGEATNDLYDLFVDYVYVVFFLIMITPILNIIVIWKPFDNNWLSLYFKRRALEEQKKIEELNKK